MTPIGVEVKQVKNFARLLVFMLAVALILAFPGAVIAAPATGLVLQEGGTVSLPPPGQIDDYLRMNQLQMVGTHNSYHIAPEADLLKRICFFSKDAAAWDYTHLPLAEQFECQNIRQIELDVYFDPEGGLYANRAGALLVGKDIQAGIPALDRPGFKVLHVPHIDYGTHSHTLKEALETVRDWSLENGNHVPIMILMEVKGQLPVESLSLPLRAIIAVAEFFLHLFKVPFALPEPVGAEALAALEEEILSVFDREHIISPDDVRGDYLTLEEAVLTEGWPTLGEARGRVFFALDNEDEVRELYLEGAPTLKGKIMFTSSPPGQPSAAFIKMNDPMGQNEALIREYVRQGYIVRTRADADLVEGIAGNTERCEAAFNSGAQYISTDFPSSGDSGYMVTLPGAEGYAARCNPVNAIHADDRDLYELLEPPK